MELEEGKYYHIYNRGNNREDLFYEVRNYEYFLKQYTEHVAPYAETFAYCLMKNHFHLFIRVREESERLERFDISKRYVKSPSSPSEAFRHFFIGYAKAINKAYGRTGALFQRPFGRREVTSDEYFAQLIFYIHFNPQKHGFLKDFRKYQHSSYSQFLTKQQTLIERETVIDWFNGEGAFVEFHNRMAAEYPIASFIDEDNF